MACQDSKLADVISVLNSALQVALLLVEEQDPAIQHAGIDAAQIRDAVFRAATAVHGLRLMTQTEGLRYSPAAATARDAEVPSRGKDTAKRVAAGAAVGAALGGILKGAKGAFTGAAIGAGGATVYQLATHGKESTSRPNTKIERTRAILWRFGSVTTGEESSGLGTEDSERTIFSS
jgi:hypothetical protein